MRESLAIEANQPAEGYYLYSKRDKSRGFNDGCIVWWRPNGAGYTNFLEDAGVYTEEQKQKDARHKDLVYVPVAKVHAAMKTRSYAWLRDIEEAGG